MINQPFPKSASVSVTDAVTQFSGYGFTIQSYCQAITQLPDFDFSGDADLVKYQDDINQILSQAKSLANDYLDSTVDMVVGVVGDQIYFIAQQNVRLDAYNAGHLSAQALSRDLQGIISSQVPDYRKSSQDAGDAFAAFSNKLSSNTLAFQGKVNDMNKAIDGEKGELSKLQDQLADINSSIAHDNTMQVIGGGIAATGMTTVIIGAFIMLGAPGIGGLIVVAGGIFILGGGAMLLGSGGEAYKKLEKHATDVLQKIVGIKTEMAQAHHSVGLINAQNQQATLASQAAQNMTDIWDNIAADLQKIIDKITADETGSFTQEVKDYQKNIKALAKACQNIQDNFTEPTLIQDDSKTVSQLIDQQNIRFA